MLRPHGFFCGIRKCPFSSPLVRPDACRPNLSLDVNNSIALYFLRRGRSRVARARIILRDRRFLRRGRTNSGWNMRSHARVVRRRLLLAHPLWASLTEFPPGVVSAPQRNTRADDACANVCNIPTSPAGCESLVAANKINSLTRIALVAEKGEIEWGSEVSYVEYAPICFAALSLSLSRLLLGKVIRVMRFRQVWTNSSSRDFYNRHVVVRFYPRFTADSIVITIWLNFILSRTMSGETKNREERISYTGKLSEIYLFV